MWTLINSQWPQGSAPLRIIGWWRPIWVINLVSLSSRQTWRWLPICLLPQNQSSRGSRPRGPPGGSAPGLQRARSIATPMRAVTTSTVPCPLRRSNVLISRQPLSMKSGLRAFPSALTCLRAPNSVTLDRKRKPQQLAAGLARSALQPTPNGGCSAPSSCCRMGSPLTQRKNRLRRSKTQPM